MNQDLSGTKSGTCHAGGSHEEIMPCAVSDVHQHLRYLSDDLIIKILSASPWSLEEHIRCLPEELGTLSILAAYPSLQDGVLHLNCSRLSPAVCTAILNTMANGGVPIQQLILMGLPTRRSGESQVLIDFIAALCKAIRQHPRHLEVDVTSLPEGLAQEVFHAIGSTYSLNTLVVHAASSDSYRFLLPGVLEKLTNLSSLTLSSSSMQPKCCTGSNLPRTLASLTSLTELDLDCISSTVLSSFLSALGQLQILDACVQLSDHGASAFAASLRCLSSLKTLRIAYGDQDDGQEEYLPAIISSLRCLPDLEGLDIETFVLPKHSTMELLAAVQNMQSLVALRINLEMIDADVVRIFHAVSLGGLCTELCLEAQYTSESVSEVFMEYLGQITSLSRLEIDADVKCPASGSVITNMPLARLELLTSLHLRGRKEILNTGGIFPLLSCFPNLVELSCHADRYGKEVTGILLGRYSDLPNLRLLSLIGMHYVPKSTPVIKESDSQRWLSKLNRLALTGLEDGGDTNLSEVWDALKKLDGVSDLEISRCYFGVNDRYLLGQTLAGLMSLSRLKLSHLRGCHTGSELCSSLIQCTWTGLEYLEISSSHLGTNDAHHLSSLLANMRKLSELQIMDNSFSNSDVRCVVESLLRLPKLRSLRIHRNPFKEEGVLALADLLKYSPTFRELFVSRSSLGALDVSNLLCLDNDPFTSVILVA